MNIAEMVQGNKWAVSISPEPSPEIFNGGGFAFLWGGFGFMGGSL